MKRAAFLAGAALALSLATNAAAETPKARALTSLDDARACVPLADGRFAVATGGGLAILRSQGREPAKVFTSLDGLPDTRVHTVVEGADGLWVGTEGGAALVELGATPRVGRVVAGAPVHAIVTGAGGVVLGTWGSGVLRLVDARALPVALPTTAGGKHVAAMAEHAGALHVAYSDGPPARVEHGVLRPIPGTPSHGQALASAGSRLLLGDLEGVYGIDTAVSSLASVDARGLAFNAGEWLVATYGSGLLVGKSGATLRAEAGLPRWVQGIAVRGRIRCAATTEGPFVDEGSGWRKLGTEGPPSNDVTTLAAQGDRVLVGTFDRGAALYRAGAFQGVSGLAPDETVNASAWQGEGRLWLGTAHGLVRADVNPAGATVTRRLGTADGLPSSTIRAILVLSPDKLLVGTEEGAAFVEGDRISLLAARKKGGAQPLGSPMHATWALARAGDGTLFVGTSTGLYYGKDGAFQRASVATGDLEDDWVTALAVSGDGAKLEVFAGTYSGGVTHLGFEGAKRPHASHLGGGYINPDGLTLQGDQLLASTMDGLLVRPAAHDSAAWETRAGASSGRDVTVSRAVGAALWVASRRGIAVTLL